MHLLLMHVKQINQVHHMEQAHALPHIGTTKLINIKCMVSLHVRCFSQVLTVRASRISSSGITPICRTDNAFDKVLTCRERVHGSGAESILSAGQRL